MRVTRSVWEDSYRGDECLSDQHAKDVREGNRLPCGLLGPQSLDVVGDVFGQQQPQRVAADSIHQLLVHVLWTLVWKVWVWVEAGHVPAGAEEEKTERNLTTNHSLPAEEISPSSSQCNMSGRLNKTRRSINTASWNKPELFVAWWQLHTSAAAGTKAFRGGEETMPTDECTKKDKCGNKERWRVRESETNHVEPDRPAIYVAQSRTPDSNKALITPEKPTMARKPPPEPAMAITGTWKRWERIRRGNEDACELGINRR